MVNENHSFLLHTSTCVYAATILLIFLRGPEVKLLNGLKVMQGFEIMLSHVVNVLTFSWIAGPNDAVIIKVNGQTWG